MSNFETWWEREGQEFLFALNTTTDDDIKLVAEIAWKNGAYCADQAEWEPVAWSTQDIYKDGVFVKRQIKASPDSPWIDYAAPVRTKDLTDDEINALIDKSWIELMTIKEFARAVIAADRRKNK